MLSEVGPFCFLFLLFIGSIMRKGGPDLQFVLYMQFFLLLLREELDFFRSTLLIAFQTTLGLGFDVSEEQIPGMLTFEFLRSIWL